MRNLKVMTMLYIFTQESIYKFKTVHTQQLKSLTKYKYINSTCVLIIIKIK